MGGSLGPVLANIIMTECEKVIVDMLMKEKVIMFYTRYVGNTLLKFTIYTFENSVSHLPDIEICPNGLGIYHKHTQTGQYAHITSYTSWRWKTSWICSLVIRAKKMCSANYFNNKIQLIKRYAVWNGYPQNVVNGIIKHTLCNNDHNNTFRLQLGESLIIAICTHVVKVYNNYASTLIMYKVNFFFYSLFYVDTNFSFTNLQTVL